MDPVDTPATHWPQCRLLALLDRLAAHEGYTECAIPGLQLVRINRALPRMPVLYEPSLCLISQGRKRGFVGAQQIHFDARHYVVLSVPLPFESETDATPERPLLGLTLRLDRLLLAELALALDADAPMAAIDPAAAHSIFSSPIEAPLELAVLRLLEAAADPREARLLGPGLLREVHYRLLVGAQGASVRAALVQDSRFGRIARALQRIHAGYAETLDVGALAREAAMSVPAFHAHFRRITASSPMQYVKATRLHQARLRMARAGVTAAQAAGLVGYASATQFSRDFKRLFGRTPGAEAAHVRGLLALRMLAA